MYFQLRKYFFKRKSFLKKNYLDKIMWKCFYFYKITIKNIKKPTTSKDIENVLKRIVDNLKEKIIY